MPRFSEINSLLLSNRNALEFFSIRASNFYKTSSLDFNMYIDTFLEKLLMKLTKYFVAPIDVILMGVANV
jgi:hypothetical protein